MIEKVNPKHPDKVADRIAGAIVDLAYKLQENPKIAVEVLIGHEHCKIIIESSVKFNETDIFDLVYRITETNNINIEIISVPQDIELAKNQEEKIEGFLRSILFKILYGREEYLKNIIVADLNSSDNTKDIARKLSKDYDILKVTSWKDCKEIMDNVDEQ